MNTIQKSIAIVLFSMVFLFSSVAVFSQNEEKTTGTENTSKQTTEYFKGGMKIDKVGDDSVIIHINKHDFKGFSGDKCTIWKRKGKYNGHWAGVELGWNGYVNKDFNMTFPADQQYLNLNTSRSLMVNLNPIEFNLNLVKNRFGLTSGLGFTLNNYYFSGNYMMIPDSTKLVAYRAVDEKGNNAAMEVNKLFVSWITLPILFEFQTNSGIKLSSFHVSLGVIGGIRLQSYTKQVFKNADNITYYLQDENGKTVASVYVDDKPVRKHSQYHLNPFKVDATLRVGWSFLNLWTTYSLTPMYQKDQGPELYPWTIGVTLLGW